MIAKTIPFLDILYTICALATLLGMLGEFGRKRPVNGLRVLGLGAVVCGLELLIVANLIYHWPWSAIFERYIQHGPYLVPYLMHEYFW